MPPIFTSEQGTSSSLLTLIQMGLTVGLGRMTVQETMCTRINTLSYAGTSFSELITGTIITNALKSESVQMATSLLVASATGRAN